MRKSIDRAMVGKKFVVKIGFRKADKDDKSWMGYFAKYFTAIESKHIYEHVEMRFSDGIVTSITQKPGKIHYLKDKMMSHWKYSRFYELYVTWDEEQIMQSYAENAARNEIPFNKCGMYWNFTPCCFPIDKKGKAFFCSEYIVTLLQLIGLLNDLDSYTTSPNKLFETIEKHPDFKSSYNAVFVDKIHSIIGSNNNNNNNNNSNNSNNKSIKITNIKQSHGIKHK